MRLRGQFAIGTCAAMLFVGPAFAALDWEKNVGPTARGAFPNPRPLRATYQFGWNQVVAANAEIVFGKNDGHLELTGSGQTLGVVRALWKFNVQHRAIADAQSLRPISMHEIDEERSKVITTDLAFKNNGVLRTRTDSKAKKPAAPKGFQFPVLFDLHSALLFVRSQPLADGSVYRLVVYPETTAYLATITVVDHEKINVPAGNYSAIKLDVQLSKIGKDRALEPHKKFRRASAWISDDADRLLLRIEAAVFIGTVFVDLQTVQFGSEKP